MASKSRVDQQLLAVFGFCKLEKEDALQKRSLGVTIGNKSWGWDRLTVDKSYTLDRRNDTKLLDSSWAMT